MGGFFAITRDLPDLRIFEDANVELSCLLRFRIEPKKDLSSSSDFPRRFSARAQALATANILPFACLLTSGTANLRAEPQNPVRRNEQN
ncbi:MAG TPA: hypothetical protein VJ248_02750 [Candidatus Udaeobacter sp.]|nr:hypothetical protein [Candidatus Udaeobacter sp.]